MPDATHAGVETFTIEGDATNLVRDFAVHNTPTFVQAGGPARWLTLGRHIAPDGTLNISWTNNLSVDKMFIRQLPTPEEAYGWIGGRSAIHHGSFVGGQG